MGKSLMLFIAIAAFMYMAFVCCLYASQRNMMFVADKRTPYSNDRTMQRVTVTTQDHLDINGWYWPPKDKTKPVILYFHGNGGNIGGREIKIQDYLLHGYGVLLAEYRGYGGNKGLPSEQGLYADARAYMLWLMAGAQIPASHIILYGESIGTGVAVQMATEFNVSALVLEGAFDSMTSVIQHRYPYVPVTILLKDKFSSIDKIASVKIPVLIVAADHDQIIPAKMSEALFAKANHPKQYTIIKNADHNNMHEHGLSAVVLAFLNGIDFSVNPAKNKPHAM